MTTSMAIYDYYTTYADSRLNSLRRCDTFVPMTTHHTNNNMDTLRIHINSAMENSAYTYNAFKRVLF